MADESRPHYYSDTPPAAEIPPRRILPGWLLPTLGIGFALGLGWILYRGCAIEPGSGVRSDEPGRATANPWPTVLTDLRRQSDPAGCRAALDRLDDSLTFNATPELQPESLSPELAQDYQKSLLLTAPELNEIRSANYSPLDAHYLADCLYLRDVARSLDASKRPPLEQAVLAFELVQRQVADWAWVQVDSQGRGERMPPVPPTQVFNRGGGTSYERGLTFLAVARQLGLDGCFVGSPEAGAKSVDTALDPKLAPGGPMWGVGIRIDADIYLFDPVRGKPFPAPGGKPATLAQLRADPGLLKPWRDDKDRPWVVPDADVTRATVYPYVELSALAPRMKRLESELRADAPPVRLAQDWAKLQARFAAPDRTVAVWNPGEPFTPLRSLSSFLPPKDGGLSPLPDLQVQLQRAMIPAVLLGRDSPVAGIERLRIEVVGRYAKSFLEPPSPKEQVTRGQFSEVVPILVGRLREFQAAEDRLRAERTRDPAVVNDFLTNLAAVEVKKRLARDKERDGLGPLTLQARQAEAELYKKGSNAAGALVDLSLAEIGSAEATFLIALAMHEQAERAQTRGDAKAARSAWAEASGWWARYAPYPERIGESFPGRGAQVSRLRARAEKLAGTS